MIRRLLQRLFGPSGDVYVVIDTGYVHTMIIGISARQQGAELIRARYAERVGKGHTDLVQHITDRTIIENHELQDTE